MENARTEEEKIIKDIRNIFSQEKQLKQLEIEYLEIQKHFLSMKTNIIYKSVGVNNFGATVILNMKKMVTEIKHYQNTISKNRTCGKFN